MLSGRKCHASLSYAEHVYVIGGISSSLKGECERLEYSANKWEELPTLPSSYLNAGMIGLDEQEALHVIGGCSNRGSLVIIQAFQIPTQKWTILPLRLPTKDWNNPCSKLNETGVFFVLNKKLYTFKPASCAIEYVKTLLQDARIEFGPCYYNSGILSCSSA
mmetsp:Transcript_2964/g.6228  ORF Transcript_2964/g.6228 Transcript_2964/m.6228 type:complete len:162 (-) Transcript_2964:92-577(-)